MAETPYSLGRLVVPDNRDANYPMAEMLPPKDAVAGMTYRYWWANGWWGDQGRTSQCVAYAWTHWVEDGHVTHPKDATPFQDPANTYHEAQQMDQWPGENYDGTSVRAGAKVLQGKGFITSYHWAYDAFTVAHAILSTGPVVVGTNWYNDMFSPDANGIIKVGGSLAGGHAYLLDGVNMNKKLFRIKNSWNRSWGHKGFAYISFDDMNSLLQNSGEACLAVENPNV